MGLNVGVVRAKQLLHPFPGQVLRQVDKFATTVITLSGIAFGILVGQYRTLRLHHPGAGIVFRSDKLYVVFLPGPLCIDGICQFIIKSANAETLVKHSLVQFLFWAAFHSNIFEVSNVDREIRERSSRCLDPGARFAHNSLRKRTRDIRKQPWPNTYIR